MRSAMTPRKRSPRKQPIKIDPKRDHIIKFPHALTPENRASVIAFAQAMSHPAPAHPRGDRPYEDREPAEPPPSYYTRFADRDPAMAAEFTRILSGRLDDINAADVRKAEQEQRDAEPTLGPEPGQLNRKNRIGMAAKTQRTNP
jgi:hypothetical protein